MSPIIRQLVSTLAAVSALSMTACQSGPKFIPHDGYAEVKRSDPPELFTTRAPTRPYRQVGLIEVSAPAEADELEVALKILERAQAAGCELLVSEQLAGANGSTARTPWGTRVMLAHEGMEPAERPSREPTTTDRAAIDRPAPSRLFRFVCGIYSGSGDPASGA